jgi:hypothetical protein
MRLILWASALNMLLFTLYSNIGMLAAGIAVAGLCYGAGFSSFRRLQSTCTHEALWG